MKLVLAIIKPFRLDKVRRALSDIGVQGITVSEVKGFGRQKGRTDVSRGPEYAVNFVPKLKIEIVTDVDAVNAIVDVIREAASTGKIGDGKIFVFDVDHVVRIRTGERNREAL